MLTWEDRLAQLHNTDVYNFYSSGEEVLREYTNGAPPSEIGAALDQVEYYFETVQPLIKGNPVGTYTWQWQEMLKGQGEFDNLIGSTHGGWGFNEQDLQYYWHVIGGDGGQETKHLEPNLANILPVEELQTNAFFDMSVDKPLFTTNISGSTYAQVNRNRILSDAIPALTLPVGANPIPAFDAINRNFNMSTDDIENGWPIARLSRPDGNKWHHSDFDYVAYPYTHKLFDTMVIEGDLK